MHPLQSSYSFEILNNLFTPFLSQNSNQAMKMIRLRSKRFSRTNSKLEKGVEKNSGDSSEIKWELRPGGMLVQKRESIGEKDFITLKVSNVSHWHDVSIGATSTFGELKMLLSLVTELEPGEQRLLYKGKEREDNEHLHMVGVKDKDKVLLLEDPAIKERKLRSFIEGRRAKEPLGSTCRTISV